MSSLAMAGDSSSRVKRSRDCGADQGTGGGGMLGLFKLPRHHIRRRLPPEALPGYADVEVHAEIMFSDLDDAQRECAVSAILSVWICNSLEAGLFQLSASDFIDIQKGGILSGRVLDLTANHRMLQVLDGMIATGMIPAIASFDARAYVG